ncbi:hypothetical protein ADK53_11995, partial [Streptomyces sp. WM6373]
MEFGRIETRRSDFAPPPGGVLRIEASIALPDVTGAGAAGYWPVFWTLGAPLRDGYTGWPGVGEFDVMESVNGRDTVFGSMHCGVLEGGPCQEPVGLTSGPQPCSGCRAAFHSYAVEVDRAPGAEEVRWYLDGRLYHRVTADRLDSGTWGRAVDHGLFLILNVAVGGTLPRADGADVGPGTQPGHPMRVDHVTVSARERNEQADTGIPITFRKCGVTLGNGCHTGGSWICLVWATRAVCAAIRRGWRPECGSPAGRREPLKSKGSILHVCFSRHPPRSRHPAGGRHPDRRRH